MLVKGAPGDHADVMAWKHHRFTVHLWVKSNYPRWIPLRECKGFDVSFVVSLNKEWNKQSKSRYDAHVTLLFSKVAASHL